MSDQVRGRFEASPEAVREARVFLQNAMAGRVDPDMQSELTLVLSELASNVVRHARTPFEVVVETNGHVRIEVEDGSIDALVPKAASDEGGRGLAIIDRLCDRWGVLILRENKCVWCERDQPDRGTAAIFPPGRLELGAVAGNLEVEVSRMAVIALRGEIDLAGLDDLQSAIEPHLAPGQTVVLDLSGVMFADSTLLKVLHRAHGKVSNLGGALLVRNPSAQIRQLLSLGDLDHLAQTEVDRQNDPPSGNAAPRSGSTTENPPC
jgi:anti-anti-sigma factor